MEHKYKICHLTSVHKAHDLRIFLKECSSLAKAGFNTHIIAVNCKEQQENGVNIINVNVSYSSRITRIIKAPRAVYKKALKLDANIYHFHDPEFLPYAIKLKKKGKKVIYDTHEDVPRQILGKYYISKIFRSTLALLFEKFENYIAKRLDFIITATPFIRDRFLKINRSVVDINNYPLLHEIPEKTVWQNKNNTVSYIGGISKIRGIAEIVKAMKKAKNAKLNLAGSYTPDDFRQELMQLEGWNKVVEYGMVSREKVAEIIGKSFAGIVTYLPLPNHKNAQPNKIYEYMAAGIPVIASNFPLWKEIIENNNCGICVDPLNPDEIADAINYLLSNQKIAEEMGINGRKVVKKKYNWEIEEKKLIDVYQKIIN